MTIKELKKVLEEYPEDWEVFSYGTFSNKVGIEATAMRILPVVKRVIKDEIDDPFIVERPCNATSGAKKCLIL